MTAGVVTSATHPVAPQIGDAIFETDTGNILYYYGPNDGWKPSQDLGGRLLGYVEAYAPISVSSFATATCLTLSFAPNIVRGRKLLWVANYPLGKTTGSAGTVFLADINDNVLSDRVFNNGLSVSIESGFTLLYEETISLTQQINVGKKLKITGNNAWMNQSSIPNRKYYLYCFDGGSVIASASPPVTYALWNVALWNATNSKWV